ncbi:MAG: glycosyltransferase [Pseudomonadota bacterium]
MWEQASSGTPLAVLLFVSGHGLGHITRSAVLAEALLGTGAIGRLLVAAPRRGWCFFTASTASDPRIDLWDVETDFGIPFGAGEMIPDVVTLQGAVERWVSSWPDAIGAGYRHLAANHIDLAVVDASPLGCAMAKKAGIPCILVSNFEWHAQYVGLGLKGAAIDQIGEAYVSSVRYLRYPFHLASRALATVPTIDVPACVRAADSASVARLVERLPSPRVLLSIGGILDLVEPIEIDPIGGSVIFTRGIRVHAPRTATVVDLSSEQADLVPYIGAADVVVTKAGWSTVAETAVARRPLLIIRRPGMPEDDSTARQVVARGLGHCTTLTELPERLYSLLQAGFPPTPGLVNNPGAVAEACLAGSLL